MASVNVITATLKLDITSFTTSLNQAIGQLTKLKTTTEQLSGSGRGIKKISNDIEKLKTATGQNISSMDNFKRKINEIELS